MSSKQIPSNQFNGFFDHYDLWKRKKPSQHYNRAYYADLPDGSKLVIEYNFLREIVRIEYYPDPHSTDGFRSYYALIQKGNILQEREFESNRPISLFSRISKYKKYFSYLWDEQILKTIGGIYNIPLESDHPLATSDFNLLHFKKSFAKIKIKNFYYYLNRFLKNKERYYHSLTKTQRFFYRSLTDLFDFLIILFIAHFFYIGKITSFMFSFLSVFYSIASSFIDFFWRRRPPLIFKTILLSLPGIIIFFFQYQLNLWGIYEPANEYLYLLKSFLYEQFLNTKNTLLSFLI